MIIKSSNDLCFYIRNTMVVLNRSIRTSNIIMSFKMGSIEVIVNEKNIISINYNN